MVQLIGNFDFAALCLPTVPWGKSTRKMQFFRKVIIEIDRCCFLNRSVSVFAAADLFFFSSSNYFLFFPPIEFSPATERSSLDDDGVSVSILGKSEETGHAFDEMNVLLYFVPIFESICEFGGGKRRPQKQSEKSHFFLQFQTTLLKRVYLPPQHQLNKLTTHIFFHPPTTERRSPNPRGFNHGPPTRVRDGWRSHRTSVRRDEIRRRRRRGYAAIRHRVFAHFIRYFYHFELRAV